MSIVIDANIAIAWFRKSPSHFADAALDSLCVDGAIVPAVRNGIPLATIDKKLAAAAREAGVGFVPT